MLRTVLLFVICALLLALLALWFDTKGQLRRIHWKAPAPLALDASAMVTALPVRGDINQGQLLETLERPLFSPTRRPPPPPPPPKPADAEEQALPLTDVHVYGLYGAERNGGAILRVDGKTQRVAVNDNIKGWRLTSIGERTLTFRRGGRQHVLELVHVIPKVALPPVGSPPVAGAGRTPARPTSAARRRAVVAGGAAEAAVAPPAETSPVTPAPAVAPTPAAAASAPAPSRPASPPQYRGLQSAKKP